MHVGVLSFGLVLLIAGGLLLVVPITSGSIAPHTFYTNTRPLFVENVSVPAGVIINPTYYFTASWTSSLSTQPNQSVNGLEVVSCGTDPSCTGLNYQQPVAIGYGDAGSLSWTGIGKQYFQIFPASFKINANITATVSYTGPVAGGLLGLGMIAGGSIVAVAALIARTRRRRTLPTV